MTAEVVTGVEAAPVGRRSPAVALRGCGSSRRSSRRRCCSRILFFVPLAVMFVFSLWTTNANLDIVPVWNLDNYAQFFNEPRRTSGRSLQDRDHRAPR